MISKQNTANIYLYEEINESEIRLLRVFGAYPQVQIPEIIDGKYVVTIGAYCFAENARLSKEQEKEWIQYVHLNCLEGDVRELAGKYIQQVSLPDTVKCLESYAFYNCSELEQIQVGVNLIEVNGDSFMNCRKLRKLIMRGSVKEQTGLPYILNQITSEIEVSFVMKNQKNVNDKLVEPGTVTGTESDSGNIQMRLIYPEFTESYEEIGPAHIFRLQVEGQGFRARKQFQNGVVDLNGYDQVFEMARSMESVRTLSQMALDRLTYPMELREEQRVQYEQYLIEHENELMKILVDAKDMEQLQFVCESDMVSNLAIEQAIRQASMQGWTKGSAGMIRWRKRESQEEEYSF